MQLFPQQHSEKKQIFSFPTSGWSGSEWHQCEHGENGKHCAGLTLEAALAQ